VKDLIKYIKQALELEVWAELGAPLVGQESIILKLV
jgi:hypothetical protein